MSGKDSSGHSQPHSKTGLNLTFLLEMVNSCSNDENPPFLTVLGIIGIKVGISPCISARFGEK